MYADLDEIEESIAYNEEFPMENVTGMTEKFAGMRKALKEAEKKIEENEMTLDMLHVEHTREVLLLNFKSSFKMHNWLQTFGLRCIMLHNIY